MLRHRPQDDDEDDDDDDTAFESVAELVAKPEVAMLGLGLEAFVGRSGEDAWIRLGGAVDELWEDVVEELDEHLDWTGAGSVEVADYPSASESAAAEPTSTRTGRRRHRGRRRRRRTAPTSTIPAAAG